MKLLCCLFFLFLTGCMAPEPTKWVNAPLVDITIQPIIVGHWAEKTALNRIDKANEIFRKYQINLDVLEPLDIKFDANVRGIEQILELRSKYIGTALPVFFVDDIYRSIGVGMNDPQFAVISFAADGGALAHEIGHALKLQHCEHDWWNWNGHRIMTGSTCYFRKWFSDAEVELMRSQIKVKQSLKPVGSKTRFVAAKKLWAMK